MTELTAMICFFENSLCETPFLLFSAVNICPTKATKKHKGLLIKDSRLLTPDYGLYGYQFDKILPVDIIGKQNNEYRDKTHDL